MPSGGVVKLEVVGGVGREGREEVIETGIVNAILRENCVCTDLVEINWVGCMGGQAEEADNGDEQDGKRERIHFDELDLFVCKTMQD